MTYFFRGFKLLSKFKLILLQANNRQSLFLKRTSTKYYNFKIKNSRNTTNFKFFYSTS